jgi:hypothetical protein
VHVVGPQPGRPRVHLLEVALRLLGRGRGGSQVHVGLVHGLVGGGDTAVVPSLRLGAQVRGLLVQGGQPPQHAAVVGGLEIGRLNVAHWCP